MLAQALIFSQTILGTSVIWISLYTNTPTTSAYTHVTIEASVGVNTPERIPPKRMTGISMAQIASLVVSRRTFHPALSCLG